nr:MAG TPA: hypothetical protein [Caudoviricetes sp.]
MALSTLPAEVPRTCTCPPRSHRRSRRRSPRIGTASRRRPP